MASMVISIHAPRVGSDGESGPDGHRGVISIHAPRVGSDGSTSTVHQSSPIFQSTLPVWGATLRPARSMPADFNFNPRSPCGERRQPSHGFSPAPRNFNPRSPCGERHGWGGVQLWEVVISIHAPRVGSDSARPLRGGGTTNFNPRSPCGERQSYWAQLLAGIEFQSTLPVWGATGTLPVKSRGGGTISIHAPRVGSDSLVNKIKILRMISIHAPRVGSDS